MRAILRVLSLLLLLAGGKCVAQDYHFQGNMTRPQLESYLNRSAVTEFDSLHRGLKTYNDLINFAARNNIRILCSCYSVGYASELTINHGMFDSVVNFVEDVNRAYADRDLEPPLVNIAIWEAVTKDVDSIWMSRQVAEMYNVSVRRFVFDSMKYPGDTSTRICYPDITRRETQMYFYYLATRFIDCGVEDIHFGQIDLENKNDAGNVCTWNLYNKIRQYGARRNRGLVLLNGDSYGLYYKNTDTLIYDYHTAPSRVSGYYTGSDSTWTSMWVFNQSAYGGPGRLGYNECSAYGKMQGGHTCMGWYADTLPYQVALDNTITNLCNCLAATGCWTAYGFDEISWFVLQSESYKNKWLCYANRQVKLLDPNCFFVMPVRTLFTRHWWYYVALNGYGFDQEDAIVDILNGTETDCNPNDVLDLHELYFAGQKDPTAVIVYPNPAVGEVTIVFHGKENNKVSLNITDVLGREVAAWNTGVSQGNIIWNASEMEAGIYNCTASTENGTSATARIAIVK